MTYRRTETRYSLCLSIAIGVIGVGNNNNFLAHNKSNFLLSIKIFVKMYDMEDFDQIQTAEFREAFNEFDKVNECFL